MNNLWNFKTNGVKNAHLSTQFEVLLKDKKDLEVKLLIILLLNYGLYHKLQPLFC
jgi:hypothetical protein